ncbi:MAG: methyl-accepting chemotaxis protein [Rhodocyclaceae bacterium]|nr:methyl-accepting chemotaxis protein [Rhodocyclaceae bacterium]MBX3670178.1 methyl-accepting chemotaxis protein [Rhodocyclaceae bacterium]
MTSLRNLPVALRLSIATCAAVVLLMAIVLAIFAWSSQRYEKEQGLRLLEQRVVGLNNAISAFDQSLAQGIIPLARAFEAEFPNGFTLDRENRASSGSASAPLLRNQGKTANNDFSHVDHFTATTGVTATVFVRDGEDFVRIATSVKNEKGERAVGTRLARDHPGYARLLAGESYTGPAVLFGRDFVTRYDPLKTASGEVIGILYVGLEVSQQLAALKDSLRKMAVGETGYVFIVDGAAQNGGTLLLHPSLEGKSMADMRSPDGVHIFQEMQSRRSGRLEYTWQNPDQTFPQAKLLAFAEYAPRHWLIAASGYKDEFLRTSQNALATMAIAAVVLVLAISSVLWALTRSIVGKPLAELEHSLTELSRGHGNLTYRIPVKGEDEIGRVAARFNDFLERLQAMIRATAAAVGSVSESSRKLATSAQTVSQASHAQSDAASGTAGAVEQLAASIASVADAADAARREAEHSLEAAAKGNHELARVVGELQHVHGEVDMIAHSVSAFVDSVSTITAMTQQVKEIADQTNLLALNAAIEAARAGESGRGFAVVADEVRKLAEKSTTAAGEIDRVTSTLTERSSQVDAAIGKGRASLDGGLADLRQVAAGMDTAGKLVRSAAGGIGGISDSVREQTATTQDIARHVERFARMAQDNRATVDETNTLANRLQGLAGELNEHVGRFTV